MKRIASRGLTIGNISFFSMLFLCMISEVNAEAGLKSLFGDAPPQSNADMARRHADKRGRRVVVKQDVIAGSSLPNGSDSFEINLFSDTRLKVVKDRFERRDDRHFTWYGKIPEDPLSMAIFVSGDGLVSGGVFANGKLYSLRGADSASQVVAEIDQSAFANEKCDRLPASGDQSQSVVTRRDAMADDGSGIDVMVVYTPAARAAEGSAVAMNNMIALAVAETNASYANSGITTRLNLAHTAEVAYTETGNWDLDLYRLVGTGDGYMDNVHALRDQYAADVVVMLIARYDYCGLASDIMATESNAFCLVSVDCATGNYSFGHEIGHLQGARHDWFADPDTGPFAYNYNHGHVNLAGRQRTIMAYNAQCASTYPYTYCTRLPYLSNPDVSYPGTGAKTGSSIENNALTLNNTASTVANFRQRITNWRADEVDLGNNWKSLSWFGIYDTLFAPWIYHQNHGFLYPFDGSNGGVFFWDSRMQRFWWTNSTTYPFVYRFGSDATWLWYLKDSSNPRWFYNWTLGQWESKQ